MNRNERAAIWRDELAHPNSPTTRAAMQASGADDGLIAEWADLEGDNEPGNDWTVYEDFLKGAIGIAEDHDPKGEFDTPLEHARRLRYLANLWEELSKSNNEPHNQMGESQSEKELYDRLIAAREAAKQEPSAVTESIIDLPGELYVRYDPETKTFLGFGFTPINDSHPGFTHVDGPEPGCDLTEWGNPVWKGMQEYLANVHQISGETAFAVIWTEDGWKVPNHEG